MNQTIHAITTPPPATPAARAADPLAKRDRLERARALLIAQFGRAVLVDLERPELQSAPFAPHSH